MITCDQYRQREEERVRIKLERSRRSLLHFTQRTQQDYVANWHHKVIADTLDRVRRGELLRVLISVPPQHGKSELASRKWPAHMLGNDPDLRVIATSYNDELATFNGRMVRRIMMSPEYQEVFPESSLVNRTTDKLRALRASYFEVPHHDGYYLGAGINAGLTGWGFDVGIIDDPIKNWLEADSPAYRERLKVSFGAVFESRGRGISPKTGIPDRIVGIFTRWHHDDLAGYILQAAKESGEEWYVVNLPAILDTPPQPYDPRQHGEALWPSRYPVPYLDKRRIGKDPRIWNGLYQQRPEPPEGTMFQKGWWKYYDRKDLPTLLKSFREIFISVDCSFKKTGTSRVAIGVFGVGAKGGKLYLLDVDVAHMSYVETKDALRNTCARWPQARAKVIEDKANGPAVINDLEQEIAGLIAWPPEGMPMDSKEARWNAATPAVRAGSCLLPSGGVPWVDEFIFELAAVPHGAFDDQADMFAQAVQYWQGAGSSFLDKMTTW